MTSSKLSPQVRPELQAFVGKELTADKRKTIEVLAGSQVRFLGKGVAGTMEHRGGRTTVYTDDSNVITLICKG